MTRGSDDAQGADAAGESDRPQRKGFGAARAARRERARRQNLGPTVAYSRWDGTQTGFELDAYDVFGEITDDLLYHGDLNAALRRMLQSGFQDRNGEDLMGLREMLEKLRRKRKDQLDQYNLGGVYDDIAQELRDVVDQERQSLEEMAAEARESGEARRQEITEQVVEERQLQLDMLSPDLAGQVRDLQNYEFTSSEAREKFEELLDQLRQQLMQQYVDQMSGAMQNMSPEDMQRMKDMMADLNQMLEQRQAGEEPNFEEFMERYGDFFPENPETPRRAARGHGPAHGRHAVDAQLDDPRAAGPAAGAHERAHGGHGPRLPGQPARREPAQPVPRHGLGPVAELPGPGPAELRRGRGR